MAGVSRSTVSLAINNSPKVNEQTKLRILEICKAVDYQPNMMARGLVAKSTRTLCAVIPPINQVFSHSYFTETLRGIIEACTARDFHLFVTVATESFKQQNSALRLFRAKRMDGALFIGALNTDTYIRELMDKGCPTILVNTSIPGLPQVVADNVTGTLQAMEHLHKLGHKRIGFIKGLDNVTTSVDRTEGFNLSRERFNLDRDRELVAFGNFSEQSGYEAMKQLLSIPKPPTAVFTTNDMMAIGAIQALREAGKSVPKDMAIMGGDDILMARYITPKLTTIRQDMHKIGFIAADLMLEAIVNETRSRSSASSNGNASSSSNGNGHHAAGAAASALKLASAVGAVAIAEEEDELEPVMPILTLDRQVVTTELIVRESCGAVASLDRA